MKKVTKLDKRYEDIEKSFGTLSEEQVKKELKNLTKELEGKKDTLERMDANSEKRKELEKNIKDIENKINNIKGYTKNKTQIKKIRDYKSLLEEKLKQTSNVKTSIEKDLENFKKELSNVEKQLKDEKYTMTLDQYQYNDLLSNRENLKKEIEKLTIDGKKATDRIVELQAKIGKCNLAWKTLFVNKDWDEIQRRAMSDQERFTRKTDEKHPSLKNDNKEEEQKDEKSSIGAYDEEQMNKDVGNFVTQVKDEIKEENLPAPVSRWNKIKNFFRQITNKVKSVFGRKEEQESEKPENEVKDKPENEVKEKSGNEVRDKFLESLRQYADEEYKQQVKQEKEKAYIEAHKAQPKEEKDKTTEEVEK